MQWIVYGARECYTFTYVLCIVCLCVSIPSKANDTISYLENIRVQEFIDEQVARGLDKRMLENVFAGLTKNERVIELMNYAPERRKTWGEYRDIFITQERITKGQVFITTHQATLNRAEKTYGVPPHIIVAILGVETMYGERTGGHNVVQSLATLSFDYPRRESFFRKELASFLALCAQQGLDPSSLSGSYAGAMGYPQFMPSSYLAYAVDFNNDGRIDIWQDPTDAIGSIAHYLQKAGWKKSRAIIEKVSSQYPEAFLALSNQTLRPDILHNRLHVLGVQPRTLLQDEKVVLISTISDMQKEFWLGGHNFYVITRYNHSRLYALAVYHLAQEIHKASNAM